MLSRDVPIALPASIIVALSLVPAVPSMVFRWPAYRRCVGSCLCGALRRALSAMSPRKSPRGTGGLLAFGPGATGGIARAPVREIDHVGTEACGGWAAALNDTNEAVGAKRARANSETMMPRMCRFMDFMVVPRQSSFLTLMDMLLS
ncbi:hypothetical protein [Paraburkholderia guartelaensis]|uniref:hypothetical protein n=1 Tax=Paraburkholderia guartelaensis TaxID=2546446 RepID=UPI001408C2F3|nr:hypothetical protein [Paraburkholderia guartelaensis]